MSFKNGMRPVHPGEVLLQEYLEPLGMNRNELARRLDVPSPRVYGIVEERRAITPDTALRLGRLFGTDARFWLNLQLAYDLRAAEIESARAIEKAVQPLVA